MKRMFTLVLALCMVFTLVACGKKEESAPATNAPAASTPTPSAPAPAPAPAEDPLTWPTEGDINVLIPANTGGDTDTTFRTFSTSVGETLGANVMLTNMAGGAGAVALNELFDYDPDGYTGIWHHYDSIVLSIKGGLDGTYDELLDIAAVVPVSGGNYILTTNAQSGWSSMEEMVAYCKANPGEAIWAVEAGGWNHVYATSLANALGIEVNMVDFGASADRNAALLGNQAQLLLATPKDVVGYPDDFVGLATCSLERQDVCADIPTLKELGFGDIENPKFYYFGFEKGTDPRIVEQMGEAIKAAVASADGKAVMDKYAYTSYEVLTGDAADAHLADFVAEYEPFVKDMLNAG